MNTYCDLTLVIMQENREMNKKKLIKGNELSCKSAMAKKSLGTLQILYPE